MTEAEKLKDTLSAIFQQKRADGCFTRPYENLASWQHDLLLREVRLRPRELPVIGYAETRKQWLIITTERIVWPLDGKTQTLSVHDVRRVRMDLNKMRAKRMEKHQVRELVIETMGHEERIIEVEEGPPFFGVWNVISNLCARNLRKEKEQAKPPVLPS